MLVGKYFMRYPQKPYAMVPDVTPAPGRVKTIFVTSFHPLIARNIVSTPIISKLTWQGIRVVVVIPGYKRGYFERTYGTSGAIFEGVETGAPIRTLALGVFKRLAEALPHTRRAAIGRVRTLSGEKKSRLYYYLFYLPAGLLGRFRLFMRLARLADFYLSPAGRFRPLLERYQPDLVFSTDVQNEHDVALMQDARRAGIAIVAMVRSWDNLTTRALRIIPDRLIVHNEIIQNEASSLYGMKAERITVVGIPHYDKYFRGPTVPRESFFRKIGLDPRKKLVIYFPICDYRMRENVVDRMVIETLANLDANVVVRFPPAESVTIAGLVKPPAMIFDRPGYVFDERIYGNRELTPEDDERLLHLLAYCDLVVAGPSTAAIDAALFDKPLLLVDFYPTTLAEAEKIYEYGTEHFSPILASGGARRAKSRDEFLSRLHEYLTHPELDHAGRARIVEEQCWRADGRSSQRVVAELLAALGHEGA